MSALLLKLIATDDAPFSKERQRENKAALIAAAYLLHNGSAKFQDIKLIGNVLNYLHSFNEKGFIDSDIEEEHARASNALVSACERRPWKLTDEEHDSILVIIGFWSDILEAATENLIRSIQFEVETTSDAAKARMTVERMKPSRRSHRKPKRKVK